MAAAADRRFLIGLGCGGGALLEKGGRPFGRPPDFPASCPRPATRYCPLGESSCHVPGTVWVTVEVETVGKNTQSTTSWQ